MFTTVRRGSVEDVALQTPVPELPLHHEAFRVSNQTMLPKSRWRRIEDYRDEAGIDQR